MLDLLIINPAAAHGIYGPLGEELIAVEPPLWCRLIAGYVRDRGYSVKIIDAEAEGWDADQTVGKIALDPAICPDGPPRLICIAVYGHQPSASTQQMWGAGELARALKARIPSPVIMVGGHPSALPERTLTEEDVDYVGFGEGLVTVEWLLNPDNDLLSKARCPGLVWRDVVGTVHVNESAPLIEGLSQLHGHAWDLLPMGRYRAHNWQCFDDLSRRQPYASIYTSLGCPYRCQFCCINAPFDSNRYRMRKPQDVVDEIEYLHEEHGISTIKITDEMFVLNERHYIAICDGLIKRGLGPKLNIWAYARVDTVLPRNLAMMRAAGIRWLALGIESGSKHVRDGASKRLRNDDIVGVVRQIQMWDINVIGNFMVGLPDDTLETMEETYRLAEECNCEFMNVYATQAYPGSALYAKALLNGLTLPTSWAGYSQHNEHSHPLDTQFISGKEVLRFRDEFFRRYFASSKYQAMIASKFGNETLAHVRKMLDYRLKRNLLEQSI